MSIKAAVLGVLLGGAMMLSVGQVHAQAAGRGGGRAAGRTAGPRVITLDEIVIEGQVQRPNAFYILNRSSLGYEVLDLRTSFTREIIRSVSDEPF